MNTATLAAVFTPVATGAVAYLTACAAVAWRFTRAQRCVKAQAMAGAQAVSFAARDGRARIDGWYLAQGGSQPAVVFVHGKDACRGDELKASTVPLARALQAAGMAVLMIDLRGHGTSSRARMTYGARERYDVLGAVDWLHAQGHAHVGVLGASMGGASALLAAAIEPGIEAVVADSAFADLSRIFERQFRKLCRLPGCVLPGALFITRLLTGEDLRRVSPLAAVPALAGRAVMVIHSEGDRFVPPEDAQRLAQASGAECWTTATQGHIGSFRAEPGAYTERVTGFFRRSLGAGQAALMSR